jgi:hypothetical protein
MEDPTLVISRRLVSIRTNHLEQTSLCKRLMWSSAISSMVFASDRKSREAKLSLLSLTGKRRDEIRIKLAARSLSSPLILAALFVVGPAWGNPQKAAGFVAASIAQAPVSQRQIIQRPKRANAGYRRRTAQKEQSRFSAEGTIKKSVRIPGDVMSILRQDRRSQTCLPAGASQTGPLSSWFVASPIHLKGAGKADLVVTARNPCLFGANIVPFWVFRNAGLRYELVLSVSALGLDVLNTKTKDYRDIRIARATATNAYSVTFKFDGMDYAAALRQPSTTASANGKR